MSATSSLLSGAMSAERLSLGRAAAGVSMLARPTMLPGMLGVDSAAATRMAWSTQMLGVREVALGLGTFVALRKGSGERLWLMAGLLCDAVDALAVGAAVVRGRVSKVTGAGIVAVAGAAVYAQLEALQASPEA